MTDRPRCPICNKPFVDWNAVKQHRHHSHPTRAFIVSSSVRSAISTARVAWDWKQIDEDKFVTPDGLVAKCTSTVEDLRGMPRPTPVYYAFGWREMPHESLALLDQLSATGHITIKDPT